MTQIVLDIDNCGQCPRVRINHTPGTGHGLDFTCSILERKISGYIEHPAEQNPVPADCPFRLTNIHVMKESLNDHESRKP